MLKVVSRLLFSWFILGDSCTKPWLLKAAIDVEAVRKCMGNPDADVDNPVLKYEQDAQVGQGTRGDVTILPTLIVNQRQYRGKLDKTAVLKAICSGYQESTDPPVCLSDTVETNECLDNHGGCWSSGSVSACQVTLCSSSTRVVHKQNDAPMQL